MYIPYVGSAQTFFGHSVTPYLVNLVNTFYENLTLLNRSGSTPKFISKIVSKVSEILEGCEIESQTIGEPVEKCSFQEHEKGKYVCNMPLGNFQRENE